mmetsp:Transcript_34601/g.75629  ORF Transcript_34601/g.75629 Transcript_34601/m.75629 type:complete len:583 (-) Transcript_34601:169-1917(-)
MAGRPLTRCVNILAIVVLILPRVCDTQSWEQSELNDQLTHSAPLQRDLPFANVGDAMAKGDFKMFDTDEVKKNLFSGSLLYQLSRAPPPQPPQMPPAPPRYSGLKMKKTKGVTIITGEDTSAEVVEDTAGTSLGDGGGIADNNETVVNTVRLSSTNGSRTTIVDGVEVVYEIPDNPTRVLLLFHECRHGATDFWEKSSSCEECTGLPEQRKIVRAAVSRNYAVFAISSRDRIHSRCWQVSLDLDGNEDLRTVDKLVDDYIPASGMGALPIYVIGLGDNGGMFASLLPHRIKVTAMTIQLSGAVIEALETPLPAAIGEFPPTLFVHMPRDEHTARAVERSVDVLRRYGVVAGEVRVKPRHVHPYLLCNRTAGLVPAHLSARIARALYTAKMTTVEGVLSDDPRHSAWRRLLLEKVFTPAERLNFTREESGAARALAQQLNLVFARHEVGADYAPLSMAWMEGDRASTAAVFSGVDFYRVTCDGEVFSELSEGLLDAVSSYEEGAQWYRANIKAAEEMLSASSNGRISADVSTTTPDSGNASRPAPLQRQQQSLPRGETNRAGGRKLAAAHHHGGRQQRPIVFR